MPNLSFDHARTRFLIKYMLNILMVFFAFTSASAAAIKPYLYEIRKGNAVSYVFGTLHFGVTLNEVRPYVDGPLHKSRKVYFEILNDRDSNRHWAEDPVSAFVDSPYMKSNGEPLSPVQRTRLVGEYGFDPRIVNVLRDDSCDMFFVALMLRAPTLDNELQMAAMDSGAEVLPLEDEELRAAAEKLDPPERCRMSDMMHDSLSTWTNILGKMIREYREGEEHSERSLELEFRNAHWLKTLVPEMAVGGVFVAVGVDHLFEKREGLLRRLRESGFNVRRVHHSIESRIKDL